MRRYGWLRVHPDFKKVVDQLTKEQGTSAYHITKDLTSKIKRRKKIIEI